MSTTPSEIDTPIENAFYETITPDLDETTEDNEIVIETPVEEEAQAEPESEEADEPEEEEAAEEESEEELYVEIKGEEVSLSQIEKWRLGNLRQSDYTQKTQANADEKRALESDRLSFEESKQSLADKLVTLESMISEDALTDEQIKEMREYEPENYIKYTEKQSARKEFLQDSKSNAKPTVDIKVEQQKVVDSNPQWWEDGKQTKVFKDDMTAISDFYKANNFTQADIDVVNGSALVAQVIIEAARTKNKTGKVESAKKMVRKAPTITKPRASAKGKNEAPVAVESLFYSTKK